MFNYNYDKWDLIDYETEVIDVIQEGEQYWVACKDTIFYVEGGGQPSDQGTINGLEVLDLKHLNGHVYHLLNEKVSGTVKMHVDWELRKIHCQVHSAQHLLCGLINKRCDAKTIAFFNDEKEIGAEMAFKTLDDETIAYLERICNEYILEDLPIEIVYPTKEEALKYAPEEKMDHDDLRAVKIGNIDYNMCGCIHVPSLRYLQMLKIERYEKTTRGYRIYFLVGDLLNHTYGLQYQELKTAASKLSTPIYEVAEGISKLQSDLKKTREELETAKDLYLASLAKEFIESDDKVIIKCFDNLDNKQLSKLASMIVRDSSKLLFFLADLGERMHVVITHSKDIQVNSGELFKQISAKYELRGGGNPFVAQGGGLKNLAIIDDLKALNLNI